MSDLKQKIKIYHENETTVTPNWYNISNGLNGSACISPQHQIETTSESQSRVGGKFKSAAQDTQLTVSRLFRYSTVTRTGRRKQ